MTRVLLMACVFAWGCHACDRRSAEGPAPVTASPDWLDGRLAAEEGRPRAGGTLVVRLAQDPKGFSRIDDAQAEGSVVRVVNGTIYETLGRVDPTHPEGALVPWLATSWSGAEALTISLKPGVRFHDGAPLTAADFKAVLELIRDERNPCVAMRSSLGPITSVETPDALTLVVRWRESSPFFHRAVLGAVPAMPARALQGAFASLAIHRAPIGTGPFRFVSFSPSERIELERFDQYHGSKAWLDRLTFRVVKDDLVAATLWEQGAFDVMTRIPPALWRSVERAPWAIRGYQRVRFEENAYAWIGWNLDRAVFADVRVRRALAMLYPAQAISKAVELELEPRTTCPFLRGSSSCDPAIEPLPFDPRAAERLLDEAGWKDTTGDGVRERDGRSLEFSFLTVSQSQRQAKLLPIFQEQLLKAGIRMRLEPVDASQLVARLRAHDFDAAALSWANADAVADQFELFHSSQVEGGKNYVQLKDEAVDELLEAIRREPEPAARSTLERRLHRRLFDQQPYLFLTTRPVLDALKRRVHGLSPTLVGYDFARAWVDAE